MPDRPSAVEPPEEASFVLITKQGRDLPGAVLPDREQHGEDPAANKVVGSETFSTGARPTGFDRDR